jgi:hypothetical protein
MRVFQNQARLKSANIADLTEAYLTLGEHSAAPNGIDSKTDRSIAQEASKKATAKSEEGNRWTPQDVEQDQQMLGAFTAIAAVFGSEDTQAIRTGTVGLHKAEILFLAKLPADKMLEIQDLVMAERMKPKHAFEFMNKMADEYSEVRELIQWCVGTKGKYWEGQFRDGAFTVTVKANRAIPRK